MATVSYIEAINQALKEEMRRDERVVIWGEDLISMNGVFGLTRAQANRRVYECWFQSVRF